MSKCIGRVSVYNKERYPLQKAKLILFFVTCKFFEKYL